MLVLLSIFIFPYFLFAEAMTASVLPRGNKDSETPHMPSGIPTEGAAGTYFSILTLKMFGFLRLTFTYDKLL